MQYDIAIIGAGPAGLAVGRVDSAADHQFGLVASRRSRSKQA
jgi:flavin-dependent dehydrogenase